MSTTWWQPAPTEASTDAPATLRHLPPLVRNATNGVMAFPAARLATVQDLRSTLTSDNPVARHGYVKLWTAQSVDLRRLLDPPPPLPPRGEGNVGRNGDPAGVAEAASLLQARREALARRLLVVLQPPPAVLLCAAGPLDWPARLFPYQVTGIHALLDTPSLLLGDEMGLGKTVQAIAALRILLYRREIARALIVTPASVLSQWQQEIARWAPDLRVMAIHGEVRERRWQWQYHAHITLTTYETLRADCLGDRHGPGAVPWDVVVLDEAQRIKNRDVEIARLCKRLPRERAWALTGTPLENRLDDVASILEFVTGSPVPVEGPALRGLLNQYQLRRRKADVLHDLPPKLVTDLLLPMTPAQRRAYDRAEQESIVELRERQEVRIAHILALLTRLKQLCNFAPNGESAKLDDLRQRLDELTADGHRALVFTQYTGEDSGARRLASALRRFSPLLFTSDLTLDARRDVLDRFQHGKHDVLILSLRVGGQGLNLQCASYVFHFDRWWNPAVERQAEDRAHRIGQTQPVNVYRYMMADTIEQRIQDVLRRKAELAALVVDTASLDVSRLLEKDDLYRLFGLQAHPTRHEDEEGC